MTQLHWNPVMDGKLINKALVGPVRAGTVLGMREEWDADPPTSFTMELERTPWHQLLDRLMLRHRDKQKFKAQTLSDERTSLAYPVVAGTSDRSNMARWTFVDDTREKNRSAALAVTTMDCATRTTGANLEGVSAGAEGAKAELKGMIGVGEMQHSVYSTEVDPDFRALILTNEGHGERSLWSFIEHYVRGEPEFKDMSLGDIQGALSDYLPREVPSEWSVSYLDASDQHEIRASVSPGEVRTLTVHVGVGDLGIFGYALKLVDPENAENFIVGDLIRIQRTERGVSLMDGELLMEDLGPLAANG